MFTIFVLNLFYYYVLGSIIEVYSHRFRITGADLYVYRYMCANPEKFTQQQIAHMRDYQTLMGNLKDDLTVRFK